MSASNRRGSRSGEQMSSCLGQLFSREERLEQIRKQYARWGSTVLQFCEMFLGARSAAERATGEGFVLCFKSGHQVATQGIPVALLTMAFRVARESATSATEQLAPLPSAILRLEATERAVFILHGAMSVQMPWVAAVVGVLPEQAKQLWGQSLIRLRELLPRHFFEEQSK